jgi:hypothetical protein
MTLGQTTVSVMGLISTLSIIMLIVSTLSIGGRHAECRIVNVKLSAIMLDVVILSDNLLSDVAQSKASRDSA